MKSQWIWLDLTFTANFTDDWEGLITVFIGTKKRLRSLNFSAINFVSKLFRKKMKTAAKLTARFFIYFPVRNPPNFMTPLSENPLFSEGKNESNQKVKIKLHKLSDHAIWNVVIRARISAWKPETFLQFFWLFINPSKRVKRF